MVTDNMVSKRQEIGSSQEDGEMPLMTFFIVLSLWYAASYLALIYEQHNVQTPSRTQTRAPIESNDDVNEQYSEYLSTTRLSSLYL
jgi:hypothetical protein